MEKLGSAIDGFLLYINCEVVLESGLSNVDRTGEYGGRFVQGGLSV